ncbi:MULTISPECIES: DUF5074 domain-containing protein [unclassified Carboxylicivirga]|uniref:DUF5074 domain-containing protein n=1 Tax=Carboxylicivirga TaxID=1628153 RepID=UPI003D32C00A
MKQIYLSFLNLFIVLSSIMGQSVWLNPQEGYLSNDIITDKAFSCHDILGNNLYAIDSDGLYCYDLTTMQQTHNFGKVPDYNGWISFVTADPDGTKVWLGYTKSGLTDDRIYSVDITSGTWTHVATFPGNFDMEIANGNYYVSGLNTEGWDGVNDVNCISLLDKSGNNNHKKIIEVGGNSTGLAVDARGTVYNAQYDPTGNTLMYQWPAEIVNPVIAATDGSFLTLNDGTVITSMPGNGPYDCEVDDAGHMLFNCNDYSSGSYVALWNGTSGEMQNYKKIGVYGGSSFAWFSMLKAAGDITAGGKVYMINLGDPIAEVRLSNGPSISNPITDKLLSVNTAETVIELTNHFTPKDGEPVDYSVSTTSNTILSSAAIEGTTLTINYLNDVTGTAEITVSGTSKGDATNITFAVELRDINYSNGAFIVNEDWFGHSSGTVNYLTDDGKMVYRAYRQENTNKTLGTTTQYGTAYGDNIYFMSKQGQRLVVADAATLKEQATVPNFGVDPDGRAFVGVTPEKGYIGTSNGIYLFDIPTLGVGNQIDATNGEVGNMLRAGNYVFAVKKDAVCVINANTDALEQTISGASYSGVVQAFDGMVYIGAGTKLLKVNPYTLTQEEIILPAGIEVPSSFGFAWNANSFCASATENALFWAKPGGWSGSNTIYKYIIGDETSLSAPFISLEEGMELYGAGLRVHQSTNQIYVTGVKSGWGQNSMTNTLYVFDGTDGSEVSRTELEPYYWFPAMPLFPDAHAPVFNLTDMDIKAGDAPTKLLLTNLVSDTDNNDASILVSVIGNSDNTVAIATVEGNQLVLTPGSKAGSTQITLKATSNGKTVTESFTVTVSPATAIEESTLQQVKIYPNPCNGIFRIDEQQNTTLDVQVYNITGRLVYANTQYRSTNAIDLSQHGRGQYIVKIINDQSVTTRAIIVR